MMSRAAALAAIAVFVTAAPAAAAPRPGSLDPSFGDGGTVVATIPQVDGIAGMVVQPDGSVVVGGYFRDWPGDAHAAIVASFTPAGDLDPSFGAGGIARVALPESTTLTALGLGPSGEIVLAGSSGPAIVFVRLTPTGSPDPDFGGDGIASVEPTYGGQSLRDLVVHGDGAVTAVGTTGSRPGGFFVRVLRDGRPDPAYEPEPSRPGAGVSYLNEIELDPSGDAIMAAEHEVIYDEPAYQLVLRQPADGGPFDFAIAPLLRYETEGSGLAILDSGRIAMSGTVTPPASLRRPVLSIFSGDLDPLGARRVPLPGFQRGTAKGIATDRRGAPVLAARVSEGDRSGVGLYRFVGRRFRLDRSFGHAFGRPAAVPDGAFLRSLESSPGGGLVTFASGSAQPGHVVLQRFTDNYERRRPRVSVHQGRCADGRRRIRIRVRDASPVERVTVLLSGRRLRSGSRRVISLRMGPRAGGRRLRVIAADAAGNVRRVTRRVRDCDA
jgi:uncharacterized delta-60 repeat protein